MLPLQVDIILAFKLEKQVTNCNISKLLTGERWCKRRFYLCRCPQVDKWQSCRCGHY